MIVRAVREQEIVEFSSVREERNSVEYAMAQDNVTTHTLNFMSVVVILYVAEEELIVLHVTGLEDATVATVSEVLTCRR